MDLYSKLFIFFASGTSTDANAAAGADANAAAGAGTSGGATGASKALEGLNNVDPDGGSGASLEDNIKVIINTAIYMIGIVSVIMIIVGGVTYATSQGDPSKVKKGKDTILYGVVGLVVALIAFSIVNFVLGALGA